jgi:4-hydroxy-tetrahydrodipicolinate synthase
MQQPTGAFAPVPTPLGGDRMFDTVAQMTHLRWLAAEGLDGALILGTNGEFPSLSLDERSAVASGAAAADSGLQLMLGVGSCALPEVISMLAVAADSGYGSVLCPPPFYFRSAPAEGLAEFFRQVLDRSSLPVLLYHIPQVTGVPISDELLDLIGHHDRLAGVKDSSGDRAEIVRLTDRFSDGAYFVGNDHLVRTCMEAGGRGSITAAASVAPSLVRAVQMGETEQGVLDEVRDLLEEYGLGPAVKAILKRKGLGEFATRPPLRELGSGRANDLWDRFSRL